MTSTIKTLSAIILGAVNAYGSYSIDTAKVNSLYADLLNGAGDTTKLDNFMGNFNIKKYCGWRSAGAVMENYCVYTPEEFTSIMQSSYFNDANVIAKSCTITIGSDNLSADTACDLILKSTTTQECTKQSVQQFMNYDPYGDKILQFFDMGPAGVTNIDCPTEKGRRLMSKYQQTTEKKKPTTTTWTTKKPTTTTKKPIDECFDTKYKNPCNAAQRKSGIYYFPSCNSCCLFIQCDDFGVAFERPCAPGTFWDQDKLTCIHNNGQCHDYKCPKTTTKPPTKWTTNNPTSSPTKKWTTNKPTYNPTRAPTKKWTTTPTNKPTYKPTPAPTTTYKPTDAPTKKWTTSTPTNTPTKTWTTTNKPTYKPTGAPTKIWTTTRAPTKWTTTKKPCDKDGKGKGQNQKNRGQKW